MIISIKVVTGKPKSRIIDQMIDGTYRIELKAIPVEGKANEELIRFLSKLLGISKSKIYITSGIRSKNKLVNVDLNENIKINELLIGSKS